MTDGTDFETLEDAVEQLNSLRWKMLNNKVPGDVYSAHKAFFNTSFDEVLQNVSDQTTKEEVKKLAELYLKGLEVTCPHSMSNKEFLLEHDIIHRPGCDRSCYFMHVAPTMITLCGKHGLKEKFDVARLYSPFILF